MDVDGYKVLNISDAMVIDKYQKLLDLVDYGD